MIKRLIAMGILIVTFAISSYSMLISMSSPAPGEQDSEPSDTRIISTVEYENVPAAR